MTDIIAMSQTCTKCGATVTNDDPTIKHPLDFLHALRARGWFIPDTMPATTRDAGRPHMCNKCVSSS